MRASELATPVNNGGFLQQFGASDRKTPNAANTTASIPQVLTLLNGREISHIAASRKGSLQKSLLKARSDSDKLDIIFLSIYATHPSAKEKEQFLPMMKSANQIRTLTKAMLNSKRFLFIQ